MSQLWKDLGYRPKIITIIGIAFIILATYTTFLSLLQISSSNNQNFIGKGIIILIVIIVLVCTSIIVHGLFKGKRWSRSVSIKLSILLLILIIISVSIHVLSGNSRVTPDAAIGYIITNIIFYGIIISVLKTSKVRGYFGEG